MSGNQTELKCSVCQRPVSELKPYGGPGDPLNANLTGQKLVQTRRYMAPTYATDQWPLTGLIKRDGMIDEAAFIAKYGEKAMETFWVLTQLQTTTSRSTECRDCILLDDDECLKIQEAGYERFQIRSIMKELAAHYPAVKLLGGGSIK
jgi:hypothetical protein